MNGRMSTEEDGEIDRTWDEENKVQFFTVKPVVCPLPPDKEHWSIKD